jgi:large conductance mechanosensitive channel protein
MLQEFKTFISRGNVVDLAVGIIIGAAFTGIVNSLVRDMLMPPIGWIMGGIDFSNYFVNLSGGQYDSLAAAEAAGAATINYGRFLNAVINFFIVAAALFLIVRQVNRLHFLQDSKPKPTPREEILLQEIRDALVTRLPAPSADGKVVTRPE